MSKKTIEKPASKVKPNILDSTVISQANQSKATNTNTLKSSFWLMTD